MKRYLTVALVALAAVTAFALPYGWPNAPFLAVLVLGGVLILTVPPLLGADLLWRHGGRAHPNARFGVAALVSVPWLFVVGIAASAAGAISSPWPSSVGALIPGAILFALMEGLIAFLTLPARMPMPR